MDRRAGGRGCAVSVEGRPGATAIPPEQVKAWNELHSRPHSTPKAGPLAIFEAAGFTVTRCTQYHSTLENPDLHLDHWGTRRGDKWSCWGQTFQGSPEHILAMWEDGELGRPRGAREANCRHCHSAVFWVQTAKGKWMPCDPDGAPHFAKRCRS